MKKLLTAIACSLVFILTTSALAYESEVKALSTTIIDKSAKANRKNLAVIDFTDLQGGTTELGRFLADELSSELSDNTRGLEIIDRSNLRSILVEHKFSMSGLVNPKTIKALGKFSGVDALVIGTVTPFGDSVRVSLKVISTETAKVVASAKVDIPRTKAIEELLSREIKPVAGPGKEATAIPSQPQQQMWAENILFKLHGCTTANQTVKCEVLATNKGADKKVDVFAKEGGGSRIINEDGDVFMTDKIQVGTSVETFRSHMVLASKVPTKITFLFDNVGSDSKTLSLLEFNGQAKGVNRFNVQFRGIRLAAAGGASVMK